MIIIHLINDTYQVYNPETETVRFQGSLSDCHAYLSINQ